jgi:hypothetical protein
MVTKKVDIQALREELTTRLHDAEQQSRDAVNSGMGEDPDALADIDLYSTLLELFNRIFV